MEKTQEVVYYHRNNWPWGRSTIINTHNGAGTVKVLVENISLDTADISALSVVPEKRNNGYGKELLKLAEEEARFLGATEVHISAIDGEFTQGWYEKEGYRVAWVNRWEQYTVLRKKLV